ncbi:hypothetical protein ACF07L_31745 [Streptomyces anulatus]|uniref:hypothetical protein n=1 Tax=Streptomyces anulatus TaxID=1892 RepID=UPI0036F853AC
MSEGSEAQKFSVWLGIVVSGIGILAFFGIKSFDDLKGVGNAGGSEACDMAVAARRSVTTAVPAVSAAQHDTYAQRLLEAVEATDDEELRGSLREAAYASQGYAAWLRSEGYMTGELERFNAAEKKWTSLCEVDWSKYS